MKLKDNSFYGGISKFFSAELQNKMQKELYIKIPTYSITDTSDG